MLRLEALPNEILIGCLEYLSIFELFQSLDRLNHRFSQLIRSVPLKLDFQNTRKQTFDHFCAILSSHPEIKQQIYSLHLSNRDTYGQAQRFLADFPLDQFSRLRLLALTELDARDMPQLTPTLPALSYLHAVQFRHVDDDRDIFKVLPMASLRTLSILSFHSIQCRAHDTARITTLTIMSCSLDDLLHHLFDYFPLLRYLHVRFVSPYCHPLISETPSTRSRGMHLTHLHFDMFKYAFDDFALFANQIPNVRTLSINTRNSFSMVHAPHWENLIQSTLIHLQDFRFKFTCDRHHVDQLARFQSHFWWKERHWHTEYIVERHLACVYSVPYPSNTIKLDSHTKRFPSKMANVFERVQNVTLDHQVVVEPEQYYFPNVRSLELLTSERNDGASRHPMNVADLKRMMDVSNLTHLNISHCGREVTSRSLVELFRHAPKLSWITTDPIDLPVLFHDDELYRCVIERIRKLDILKHGYPPFENSAEMERFCRVFVHIQHLTCYLSNAIDIFALLQRLPNLSTLQVHLSTLADQQVLVDLLATESRRFNYLYSAEGIDTKVPRIMLWIGGVSD